MEGATACWLRARIVFGSLIVVALSTGLVRGEFATVINVPPDVADFTTIGSNTQVNVHDGGSIVTSCELGRMTSPLGFSCSRVPAATLS